MALRQPGIYTTEVSFSIQLLESYSLFVSLCAVQLRLVKIRKPLSADLEEALEACCISPCAFLAATLSVISAAVQCIFFASVIILFDITVVVVVLLLPKEGGRTESSCSCHLGLLSHCQQNTGSANEAEVHARSDARPVKRISAWKENDLSWLTMHIVLSQRYHAEECMCSCLTSSSIDVAEIGCFLPTQTEQLVAD